MHGLQRVPARQAETQLRGVRASTWTIVMDVLERESSRRRRKFIVTRKNFRYPTPVAVSVSVARGPPPPYHSSAKTYACMTTAYEKNATRATLVFPQADNA